MSNREIADKHKDIAFQEQVRLIRATQHMQSRWYEERYPDVQKLGMNPAEHYLRIGASLGRDPGTSFNTGFYLAQYPDAAASGINPLLHYALIGRGRGYLTRPKPDISIDSLRSRLLSLGFTDPALSDLAALAQDETAGTGTRIGAARELALWYMREAGSGADRTGYRKALSWIAETRRLAQGRGAAPGTEETPAPDLTFKAQLVVAELMCRYHLGEHGLALAAYEDAALSGELTADVLLARATLATTPEGRLDWINTVLAQSDLPPLSLTDDDTTLPYDRLTCANDLPRIMDGQKVTVLIAAFEAADTLPTALRALQEQTWQNLEILVLDDASPNPATLQVAEDFAVRDSRIRAIRMPVNGGAYVARNHGLSQATGEFVTLHDADDWAHPLRIETQIRHMKDHPHLLGCLTRQARMRNDLRFTRWTGHGHFIIPNTSSFLFRRAPVIRDFGGWDAVRISADNELIRRIRHVHGNTAVEQMNSGPLAFQRDGDSSIVADEFLGINGFLYGARRAYAEAQTRHRTRNGKDPATLRYTGSDRPFPVPAVLRPDREPKGTTRHIPVVMGSEFRMRGGSVKSCAEEMIFHQRHGLGLGVMELFRYDIYGGAPRAAMLDEIRDLIDGKVVEQVIYGDQISCDLLILRYPPCLWHHQRYLPRIDAQEIKVIVNQPPMSDYGADGVQRYDIAACAANIRCWFGRDATWHPIGPLVRNALHHHHHMELDAIDLSPQDWHNIIDIADWETGARSDRRDGTLRIGRHARDSPHKWPDNAQDIEAAYPEADGIEIHVLGGAQTACKLLGRRPANWIIHEFGARSPRDFLADIDVWIYFANPNWIESFGRTIIETMAAGVPVILPEDYRVLFGDAALYATPQTAVATARRLCANRAEYAAQVARARACVAENYSHDTHAARLRALGITLPAPPADGLVGNRAS